MRPLHSENRVARIRDRPAQATVEFSVRTSFRDLVQAWLEENETRDLAPKTKQWYAEMVRGTVLPAFGDLVPGEITTCRVDALLRAQYRIGYDRARKTRTMLDLLARGVRGPGIRLPRPHQHRDH